MTHPVTPGNPQDYPTEAADGTVHLAYFAEDTSFIWSGSAERPIQVCPGGYGEPVTDTIEPIDVPAMAGAHRMTLYQVMHTFRLVCDQYLREREAR